MDVSTNDNWPNDDTTALFQGFDGTEEFGTGRECVVEKEYAVSLDVVRNHELLLVERSSSGIWFGDENLPMSIRELFDPQDNRCESDSTRRWDTRYVVPIADTVVMTIQEDCEESGQPATSPLPDLIRRAVFVLLKMTVHRLAMDREGNWKHFDRIQRLGTVTAVALRIFGPRTGVTKSAHTNLGCRRYRNERAPKRQHH
jgi:hypothetical protein